MAIEPPIKDILSKGNLAFATHKSNIFLSKKEIFSKQNFGFEFQISIFKPL